MRYVSNSNEDDFCELISNVILFLLILSFWTAGTVENTRRTPNPLFRRRFGYTSTTKSPKTSTIQPETVSISGIGSARHSDQDHEPSIVSDRKFSNINQIDLGTEIIDQGLGEAITSISRAPLPFVASTTVRNVKITTPGAVKYDDDTEYQISKRADSLSSGCNVFYCLTHHI